MKDYFGRELEIGDTIIFMRFDIKKFFKAKIEKFGMQFRKPYAQTRQIDGKNRIQKMFIILEKKDGSKFTWIKETKNF